MIDLRPVCHVVVPVQGPFCKTQRCPDGRIIPGAVKGVSGKPLINHVHCWDDSGKIRCQAREKQSGVLQNLI
jgi:hypothetical protein